MDINAIKKVQQDATIALHYLRTTQKPLSHVTKNKSSSSPLGAPGVQVLGQKEEKMEESWDWYVPPPWGEIKAGVSVYSFYTRWCLVGDKSLENE